jgi:hypothetical protein
MIHGQQMNLGPNLEPRNMNGPVFVPLRAVVEALGGSAEWNDQSSSVTAEFNGHTANVPGGAREYNVDGEQRQMSVAPFNQESHLWVPVEFFEAFGTPAIADTNTNTVTIQ